MKDRVSRQGFGLAGSLILIGVFVLLWNFEVLPDGFWAELFLLWPALVAAVGANLLLARYRAWAGSLASLIVVGGALGAAWSLADSNDRSVALLVPRESIVVPLEGAQTARLHLTASGGALALSGAAPPGRLLVGGFAGMAFPAAQSLVRTSQAGGQRIMDIELEGAWEIPFPPRRSISPGRWVLRHAGGIPTEISIDGGATTLDLRLRELNVRSLRVAAGAANIEVALPANAGRSSAEFDLGTASLAITVPPGVAAQIDFEGGVTSLTIDESRFLRQGDGRYSSPDFASAANRVTISIDAGASDVVIR